MQITRKICKLYLLAACFALSTSASPILTAANGCEKCSYSVPGGADLPGVTTTFTDEHGHVVTQVKKEAFNNQNGQNSHIVEIEENKQLPNGYSKSFKKEYSSSSVTGVHPTFVQKPLGIEHGSFKTENLSFGGGGSSAFGAFEQQNNGHSLLSGNSGYIGTAFGSKSPADQDLSHIPGVTKTFTDESGNVVTQVKKEVYNNQNGQNAHVLEFEENKQLPNGYSKSFKKEYSSSSSVTGGVQKPLTIDSQFEQNRHHQSLLSGNSGYSGITPGHSTFFNTKQTSSNINVLPSVYPASQTHGHNTDEPDCDETGQVSVDAHFNGQKQLSLNNNYQTSPVEPHRPNIVSHSQSFHSEKVIKPVTGQQTVPVGQQSLDIGSLSTSNTASSNKFEKYESFNTQQQQVGQQSVNIEDISETSSQLNQQKEPFGQFYKPSTPVGQQSVSQTSSGSIINNQNLKPIGQENVFNSNFGQHYTNGKLITSPVNTYGQQSVNIEHISEETSSQLNQQKEPFGQFYQPNTPVGQQIQNQESFYTQKYNAAGQQIADINKHVNTNQQVNIGQQTVSSDYSQSKIPVGQQSVDISQFGSQNQEVQSSFTNFNKDAKLTADQQSQGSGGIFTSKYGGTHVLDLGTLGQTSTGSINSQNLKPVGQENVFNSNFGQHYTNGKLVTSPVNTHGQQTVVYESQRVVEKNIDLNKPDYGQLSVDSYQNNADTINHQATGYGQTLLNKPNLGQQSVDITSMLEEHQPTFQKQHFAQNVGYQSSGYSSNGEKLVSVNDQTSNVQYNKAFNKLDQLEHEVLGAQKAMNLQKDNVQTTYSSNYNLKSMPVQTGRQESYFQKKVKEHEQYVEPMSEYVPAATNSQYFASSSYVQKNTGKTSDCQNCYDVEPTVSVQQKEKIEKHFEVLPESNTYPPPLYKRIGEKISNSFQAARGKAHQFVTTIEEKVGLSQNSEKPC